MHDDEPCRVDCVQLRHQAPLPHGEQALFSTHGRQLFDPQGDGRIRPRFDGFQHAAVAGYQLPGLRSSANESRRRLSPEEQGASREGLHEGLSDRVPQRLAPESACPGRTSASSQRLAQLYEDAGREPVQ